MMDIFTSLPSFLFEDPLVKLLTTIFIVYTTVWLTLTTVPWKTSSSSSKSFGIYIPYWFGFILLLFSGSITGTLITTSASSTDTYLAGTIGGGLVFLITLLSGTNSLLSLVTTGSSFFVVFLAFHNWNYNDSTVQSILLLVTVIFTLAYALSTPVVSSVIGHGTRSLIILPFLAYFYSSLPLLPSLLDASFVTPLVPAAVCATVIGITRPRSPTFPLSKTWRHILTLSISLILSVVIVILTTLEASYTEYFIGTSCLGVGLTILLIVNEDAYSNAGPFYSIGRRTTVLQVFAVTYLMFYYETNATVTTAINSILLGYAVCTIVTTFSILALNSLGNMSSSTYRAATVDYLSVVGLITGGFLVLLAHPAVIHSRFQPIAQFFSLIYSRSPLSVYVPKVYDTVIPVAYFTDWTKDCYVSLITLCLFLLSTLTLTSLTSRTLLWTPLFTNVVSRGNPRTRSVSVTINGISSTLTPKILSFVRKYNAKVTFFITGAQANDNKDTVNSIIEQGHEIGLLSSSASADSDKTVLENVLSSNVSPPVSTGSAPRSARSGRASSVSKKTSPSSTPTATSSVVPSSTSVSNNLHWYRPACGTRNIEVLRNALDQGLGTAYWCSYPIFTSKDKLSQVTFTPALVEQTVTTELGLHRTLDGNNGKDAGTLDPTTVNGAIIAIDNDGLEKSEDIDNALTSVFDTVANAPGKSPSFITLSELCPNYGDEAEVMRVA